MDEIEKTIFQWGSFTVNNKYSVFFILIAAIIWGTTGTAQTFAPEGTHPVALGAIRLAIGGGVLLLFICIQGKLSFQGWPILPTVFAALGMAAYQPLFFSAVSVTGVAVGTVVAIGSAPILAGLLEWTFRKRLPERKWWLATLFAIIGCLLLVLNSKEVTISPLGILLALGAGLAFALYAIVSKQLLERQSPEVVVGVVFTLSAILLSPLLWMYDLTWLLQWNGIGVALHLGIFTTAFAYLLFSRGLLGVSAATAVTLSLAEPLTASILGVMIVGEKLTLFSWLGISFIFFGLALLSLQNKKEKTK